MTGIGRLTQLDRDILRILVRQGPCNGRDVRRAIQEAYHERVHDSRVYQRFDHLTDLGLVTVNDGETGRENAYAVTAAGESIVRELAVRYERALDAVDTDGGAADRPGAHIVSEGARR